MGSGNTRIAHPAFARKICSAEDAAALIEPATMSG